MATLQATVSTATVSTAVQRQPVTVTTTPIVRAIPLLEKSSDIEVLVRVEAAPVARKCAPIDLIAVLDISESMSWLPDQNNVVAKHPKQSRLDLLKIAMRFIIQQLHDDDRLAIVPFNDKLVTSVTVDGEAVTTGDKLSSISGDGRKHADDLVQALHAFHGTSFKPALEKAVKILGDRPEEERGRVGFIVFLSDGQDSNWSKRKVDVCAKLKDNKYAVHTFGFSKFHDPLALHDIAKASLGTYSFLNDGLDKITDAFAICLGGLSTVVAADARVDLKGVDGALITRIDAGGYESEVSEGGKSGNIRVPVLYADEVKKFIIHLSVPQVTTTTSPQRLLAISGQCRDATAAQLAMLPIKQEDMSIRRADAGDITADELRPDAAVLEQVMLIKVMEELAKFPVGQDKSKAAGWLRAMWSNIESSADASRWHDLAVARRVGEDVEKMASDVEQGKGIATLKSWVSSYEMQRATTMGSPENVVAAFKTDGVKEMAKKAQAPKPKAEATTTKVTLFTEPKEQAIPSNEDRKGWPVLVRVVAPAKAERAPIDLVAVLDVSFSMASKTSRKGWTRLDLLKGAMDLVTDKLAAGDHLALVPFNGKVTAGVTGLMEMTPKGRADAMAKVKKLKLSSNTKYLPALKRASDILDRRSDGDKHRPGFIFLLSDGEDMSVIGKLQGDVVKYPVHTFGMCQIGNPRSMLYVAGETKGTYHPINDDLANVTRAFGVFLAGITSVVAVNTRVDLAAAAGVLITKIDSGMYESTIQNDGKAATIDVGVMSANEEKKFLVYLDLDVPKSEPSTPQLLLTATGEYNKPASGEPKEEKMNDSKVQIQRPGGAAGGGDHQQRPCSNAVMVETVRVEIIRIVEIIVKKQEDNDEPDHHQMAKELIALWDLFLKESPVGKEAAAQLKEKLPGGDVTEMNEWLTKEGRLGVLYLHAWLASQRTQQATAMAASPQAAGAMTAVGWFQQPYMQQAAADAAFHGASLFKAPPEWAHDVCEHLCCGDCAMAVADMARLDRRLELWSRLMLEAPLLFQQSPEEEDDHFSAVFRKASLEAINRAMHHDVYLAVVHASKLRRCDGGGGQQHGQGDGSAVEEGQERIEALLGAVLKPSE